MLAFCCLCHTHKVGFSCKGPLGGKLIYNSITSKLVLHYFSHLSVQDGREGINRGRSPSLPENCWKGDLKRCSVNSITTIYKLGVFYVVWGWGRLFWSSWLTEVQSQSLCHGIKLSLDPEKCEYLKWNFPGLGFFYFADFKDSCAWTLLELL